MAKEWEASAAKMLRTFQTRVEEAGTFLKGVKQKWEVIDVENCMNLADDSGSDHDSADEVSNKENGKNDAGSTSSGDIVVRG